MQRILDKNGFWWAAILAMFGLMLLRLSGDPLQINHDCAQNLEYGELFAEGRVPYVDFVDVNPPLIMYLSAGVILLARSVKQHPVTCFNLIVWLLAMASTIGYRAQLRRAWGEQRRSWVGFMSFLWAGCSWGALEFVQFGQREHLFLLAAVPFLLLRSRRWEGGSPGRLEAVLAGCLAGLGAALKPYFVVVIVFPEVWWLCTRRRFRALPGTEALSLAATGLVYGAHFLWLPAVERVAFFDRWLPFFLRHYDVYNRSISLKVLLLLAGAVAAALLVKRGGVAPLASLAGPFLALAGGGMAACLLQSKGWGYHAIPIAGALVILAGLASLTLRERFLASGSRRLGMPA